MRNIVLTSRRDFVRGCLLSASFAVTNRLVASQPLLDVFKYTMDQYTADVALLGLEETWCRICDSFQVMGLPQSGICATRNLPRLYQLGVETTGRRDVHIEIDDSVSNAVVKLLRLSECDSVCCVNGGICIPLVSALVANGSRRLLDDNRILLVDRDSLAMKVCATIIAVNFGLTNCGNITCKRLTDEDGIDMGCSSSVLAFCTADDDLLVRRTINECQSAIILTSGDVNEIAYPSESKFWRGTAMTFPEPKVRTGKLSLVAIDKRYELRKDSV